MLLGVASLCPFLSPQQHSVHSNNRDWLPHRTNYGLPPLSLSFLIYEMGVL